VWQYFCCLTQCLRSFLKLHQIKPFCNNNLYSLYNYESLKLIFTGCHGFCCVKVNTHWMKWFLFCVKVNIHWLSWILNDLCVKVNTHWLSWFLLCVKVNTHWLKWFRINIKYKFFSIRIQIRFRLYDNHFVIHPLSKGEGTRHNLVKKKKHHTIKPGS
jgi:hypothetical protein